MASRPGIKIFVLSDLPSQLKKNTVYFLRMHKMVLILYLVIIVLIEGLFYVFSDNQNTKASQSIEILLRNDINLNSYYQLARTLSDLESVGYLSCTKLENSDLNHLIPYDTQFKKNCNKSKFIKKTFKGIDGQTWTMQYQIQTSPWLSLAHILGHISVLIFFILVWFSLKRKDEIYNLKISQEQLKNTIAKQVSHDIRSPLSALTMVAGALKDIPEDKRILIRNATQRINDIANDLLQKGQISNLQTQQPSQFGSEKNISSSPSSHSVTKEFIPALIDILVSEKRTQYREHTGLEINVDFKNSFGAFAEVNSPQLKRVVSNLINNSVEAFDNNEGKVIIGVKKVESDAKVEIFVKDNGKGIPKHILNKLGQVGISHGKEGTLAGNGLGIYHAKKTIESFGGTFEIESNEGTGTFIRIQLPLAEAPKWFANKVNLTDKKYLVSLDDDISIHQIWSGRLQSLGIDDIEHIKFQSGEAFEQYVNSNIVRLKYTLFLVDFELLNQNKTGLDIIEDLGIEKYSILVTSRYEEADIQARAARLRLPLLPKSLAGFVPIHIEAPKEKYDLILIDDDTQLIHPVWGSVAKSKNLSIRMFSSPQEFRAVVDTIDRQTPVYVDVSLGENINGIDFSREVSNFGFTEIYLATGYAPDSVNAPTFVRAVVGKDFPA